MIASAIALIILLAGLFLIRRRVLMGLASTSWPQVPGVIIKAGRVFAGHNDAGERTYDSKVVFQYVVAGRKYQASTIEALPFVLGEEQAQNIEDKFAPGTSVMVYYDPDKPGTAVLIPGLNAMTKVGLLIYLIVCFGLFVRLLIQ